MGSVELSLGLVLLGVWCVGSAPASNGNGTWILVPSGRGSFTIQPRNESLIQPRWTVMPRNFDSFIKKLANKQEKDEGVDCGSHSLSPGQTVTIKSRNFPGRYPPNESCRWTFQGTSPDSKLTISCRVFKLKPCRKSSVLITGGGLNKKYCKNQEELTETSDDNNMDVYFRTSGSRRTKKGFNCRVSASVPPTTTVPTSPVISSTTTNQASDKTCQSCGTVNRVTRIVGGIETEVNEYPWQVALVYAGSSSVFCGGSLLNDELVVTAAHCIKAMTDYEIETEVLLGAHDLDNPTAIQQRIGVAYSGYHSLYDDYTMDHDIGIILLSSPATLSDRVKPVCFPDASKDYSGYQAITSGWGTLSEGGSQPVILNEVDVPIVTNAACNENYDGEITSNMICAGHPEGGKDACQGDSGGPLVVEDNGKWVLVGVTSWGYGCARPDYPGVYARVTEYIDALMGVMESYGSNNLCDGATTAAPPATTTAAPPATATAAPPPTGSCKCGRRNPVTRIVGGQPTTVHEYPWQVGLTSYSRPYCGGSVISNQWILTAAHCVDGDSPSSVYVLIGEHNYAITSETTATEKRPVSQIIVHPQYNSGTYDNDMALLKLSSPIPFPSDNKIAPVCLPDPQNAYDDVDAIVTGWGTLSSGGSQPNELHEVTVPTMTNSKCQQSYGSSITSNMICAGLDEGGKDSCQGDSGGPMVTAGNAAQTFMVQIGVVSWGYGCAYAGYPGVYARVNNYLSWISSQIAGSETCPRP
ncbi:transmembrane protease serine 9-like [Macrobrachium rosenbergii]|uniref:transmembrane protease serine 9-like n=1 Tax=Macrobrachium rosenbergii TaxID=79674 RepID=UPI0034D53DA5